VDYSRLSLSTDIRELEQTSMQLARIGKQLEAEFGWPQDIEGAISDKSIYLVQTRNQV